MAGTSGAAPFRAQVHRIVRQVPPGRVTTYGQLAEMIPPPAGVEPSEYRRVRAQWVGRAMRHAPEDVPWHRVINSQGKISLPAGSRSAAIQRMRLEAEGIVFGRNRVVDLSQFGWEGPDQAWIEEHGLLPARPLQDNGPTQLALFPTGEDDI
jgi:methylated-DNA-protein-cysteine methyltransferase-like protein